MMNSRYSGIGYAQHGNVAHERRRASRMLIGTPSRRTIRPLPAVANKKAERQQRQIEMSRAAAFDQRLQHHQLQNDARPRTATSGPISRASQNEPVHLLATTNPQYAPRGKERAVREIKDVHQAEDQREAAGEQEGTPACSVGAHSVAEGRTSACVRRLLTVRTLRIRTTSCSPEDRRRPEIRPTYFRRSLPSVIA